MEETEAFFGWKERFIGLEMEETAHLQHSTSTSHTKPSNPVNFDKKTAIHTVAP
jgi:hypothetical protein